MSVVISSEVVLELREFPPTDAVPIVTLIEIDVPRCSLTYGTYPCEAQLGVTGNKKCFNSFATCQDRDNFTDDVFTFRFVSPSARIFDLDPTEELSHVIPSARVVRTTPAKIDPGKSLGQRESVTVTFTDHQHSDIGIDKYVVERDYDPFEQGTFWGKFRARWPSLRGMALRIYRGMLDQDISEFEQWHYVIEETRFDGDQYVVVAKDPLKLLDGDRAQAPRLSKGELAAPIDEVYSELTLSPAGIGDLEYPASGKAAIGGEEIVEFTRSGDVVTLVERGLHGTVAQEHDEGSRFQLCLEFEAESPDDIIYTLMTEYADGVDPSWIDTETWREEIESYVANLYSAVIAEPTPVRALINELIEQVGLVIWWEPQDRQIYLTVLRPVVEDARVIDGDQMIEGSFSAREQPKERVSQAWTYFNQINPLEDQSDPANYRSSVVTVDLESEVEHRGPSIKKTYSRWIQFGNRGAASRYNALILSRYRDPPRAISWSLYRGTPLPLLGRGVRVSHRSLQDDEGNLVNVPVQIVSRERRDDRTVFDAVEMLFTAQDDLEQHLIVIDSDVFNVNLRELHDSFYTEPDQYTTVLCIIEVGVKVGSSLPSEFAFDTGEWPDGVDITVLVRGRIQGAGGRGGNGGQPDTPLPPTNGEDGGPAMRVRVPITIDNQGQIYGGGGGGGGGTGFFDFDMTPFPGGKGGGGAGFLPGQSGVGVAGGSDATEDVAGAGTSDGGNGGGPGQAGESSFDSGLGSASGGAAGTAVDGESLVTYTNEGTIAGPRIN